MGGSGVLHGEDEVLALARDDELDRLHVVVEGALDAVERPVEGRAVELEHGAGRRSVPPGLPEVRLRLDEVDELAGGLDRRLQQLALIVVLRLEGRDVPALGFRGRGGLELEEECDLAGGDRGRVALVADHDEAAVAGDEDEPRPPEQLLHGEVARVEESLDGCDVTESLHAVSMLRTVSAAGFRAGRLFSMCACR